MAFDCAAVPGASSTESVERGCREPPGGSAGRLRENRGPESGLQALWLRLFIGRVARGYANYEHYFMGNIPLAAKQEEGMARRCGSTILRSQIRPPLPDSVKLTVLQVLRRSLETGAVESTSRFQVHSDVIRIYERLQFCEFLLKYPKLHLILSQNLEFNRSTL
ncbi:hypothetical protein NDU88_006143 [Pleurodeles waltl]|uniref:Uncharacterized protein n=1 Tax=Pleurodeles waltl TaxID=8319 RepID=A0AAV7PKY6_PLEWA|nr:hypothetical protein NDU88_006143 [Pleurodeles waltl]